MLARWFSWLLGAALLATVIGAALNFAEGQAFVRLAERAEPWWLLVAVLLQGGTYVAQGGIWRRIGDAAGRPVPRKTAFELSLAKLFADQALPSAGLSGSVLVAKALEQRDVPPAAVKAAVVVNIASYHLAYAVALAGALIILAWRGQANSLVIVTAVVFVLFSVGLSAAVLTLSGGHSERFTRKLPRFPALRTMIDFVAGADASLARNPHLLATAIALQGSIVLLDAATVWILIRALGVTAPVGGVFASFTIASLFRKIGIVPGGLGTFEAASVLTLRMTGVEVPVALSATLLFRGFSFWLPMLPGYWLSRRAVAPRPSKQRDPGLGAYWSLDARELVRRLGSNPEGLSSADAAERLREYGPNELREHRALTRVGVLLRQLRSPLLLLLVFAAAAAALSGEWLDSAIVLTIVVATVGISYSREYSAQAAAAALRARVRVRSSVVRDGRPALVPIEEGRARRRGVASGRQSGARR